jgi:Na+-transporting methylmalonyl-CoA/oxaloacetate decarboxylase gamma subunit
MTFSEPMDKTAVQSSFKISPDVTGQFSWNGNTLVFTPDKPLKKGQKYKITLEPGAKDLAGNELIDTPGWSFTIKGKTTSAQAPFPWLLVIAVVAAVLAVIIILAFVMMRKKGDRARPVRSVRRPVKEEPAKEEAEPVVEDDTTQTAEVVAASEGKVALQEPEDDLVTEATITHVEDEGQSNSEGPADEEPDEIVTKEDGAEEPEKEGPSEDVEERPEEERPEPGPPIQETTEETPPEPVKEEPKVEEPSEPVKEEPKVEEPPKPEPEDKTEEQKKSDLDDILKKLRM